MGNVEFVVFIVFIIEYLVNKNFFVNINVKLEKKYNGIKIWNGNKYICISL